MRGLLFCMITINHHLLPTTEWIDENETVHHKTRVLERKRPYDDVWSGQW